MSNKPVGARLDSPSPTARLDAPSLTVTPEIEALRTLLRKIGTDNPEERDDALAEAKGAARVVSAIVAAVRLENELHPIDDSGVARGLESIVARALIEMGKGKSGQ